ncbi:MAG: Asp-tRNA(Asn)/Glu-tRNA(Gln) amidotransferase subunit GatB [Candidatus Saccharimonadales bacterium]
MVTADVRSKYQATIGIETHLQLKTKTKLFAAVSNDAREAPPNTLVTHICFGLPGALPVLNQEAVRLAVRVAFALGTTPSKFSKFDRKHYFYPDLPKGYQISQYDEPIISDGQVEVPIIDNKTKAVSTFKVGITRAHLEEDAGKSVHPAGKDYSLIDLNRAGTPLLEIVSEPDMHSAASAKAYVRELYLRMKYAEVSDCNLYLGHMRFDVNVSVSTDPSKLGIRSETKNLNSFRNVEKAIEYEINRQIELLEKKRSVVQETLGWNDAKQKTFSQRTKEEAHDYRYMPDPDLPPIVLDDKYISSVRDEMPKVLEEYRIKFKDISADRNVIEDILLQPDVAKLIWRILETSSPEDARRIVFWMLRPTNNDGTGEENAIQVNESELIKLSRLVGENKLSSTAAKKVLNELLSVGGDVEKIAKARNLLQLSDENETAEIVKRVLAADSKAAEDVRKGEAKAIGFLVGQVMKLSQGRANPGLAQELIKKKLGI